MWEKKVREPPNMRKELSQCDVRTAQYEDGTVKCDKNRTDAMLVLLNITTEPSNLRKNK